MAGCTAAECKVVGRMLVAEGEEGRDVEEAQARHGVEEVEAGCGVEWLVGSY